MLENTFVHVPGIGPATEVALWSQGCLKWDDFLTGDYDCRTADRDLMHRQLEGSRQALSEGDHGFFRRSLGGSEAWRSFPEFRDRVLYLDIETDGGQSGQSITTIGMYDGEKFTCLIKGQDLDDFPDYLTDKSLLVTFYGGGFDLPMLGRRFPGLQFDQIHLDLCPTLRQLGLRGGLKKIEKQLGLNRGEDTDGLGGLDAIRLWRRYSVLRDEKALETLIAYNREDVVNLETLAEIAYNRLRTRTFTWP
ncbi:ribonuclease H-like domain-containing protein [soil metagenome]